MAAGTNILHKRKAGAFAGGELAAGEFGVDTTNGVGYFSANGSTVLAIPLKSSVKVIQCLSSKTTTRGSTSTTIPADDTVPQITEGASAGIDVTITGATGNDFLFVANVNLGESGAGAISGIALFVDSTASAIASAIGPGGYSTTYPHTALLINRISVPDTSAHTYRIRYGSNAGTTYLNGAVSNWWGSTMVSSFTVYEIAP